ncbi:hypothetical protein [Paenibacillus campi]|uniref:hypothetical protein n=1 Tax=Paenibacillus campi TaxID=3106031 RepID=UPI002B003DC0|nr:hypothetical protein [Paenibacillus sp. SGZ-1014]
MSNNGWIKFYNVFMEKGVDKLSPKEWYFYSLLVQRKSFYSHVAETTVVRITELQSIYKDKNKSARNYKNVWEQIKKLSERGVININQSEIESKGKPDYNKTIIVSFKEYPEQGFEQINSDILDKSNDPYELYFLCVLKRFNEKGFAHSMKNLAVLFDCHSDKAEKVIKTMVEKQLIRYKQGESKQSSNGQYTREANTYYLYDESIRSESVEVNVSSQDNHVEKIELNESSYGNWQGSGNLTDDDYMLYVQNEHKQEFIDVAQKKINRITKNGENESVSFMINQKIKQARERLNHQQRQLEYEAKQIKDQQIFGQVEQSDVTMIQVNDQVVTLESIEQVNNDTKIYYIGKKYDSSPNGYSHELLNTTIDKILMEYDSFNLQQRDEAKLYVEKYILNCKLSDESLEEINAELKSRIPEQQKNYKKKKDKVDISSFVQLRG